LRGQKLPPLGISCRPRTANISTLKKTIRAFIGKIWVKKHAYQILAPACMDARTKKERRSRAALRSREKLG
jgi:hypothetical protein